MLFLSLLLFVTSHQEHPRKSYLWVKDFFRNKLIRTFLYFKEKRRLSTVSRPNSRSFCLRFCLFAINESTSNLSIRGLSLPYSQFFDKFVLKNQLIWQNLVLLLTISFDSFSVHHIIQMLFVQMAKNVCPNIGYLFAKLSYAFDKFLVHLVFATLSKWQIYILQNTKK